MKKVLSAIIAASLAATLCAQSVLAAPTASATVETADEYISGSVSVTEDKDASTLAPAGPSLTSVIETADETVENFGRPDIPDGAMLMGILEGEGTKESPYLISDAETLEYFADSINSGVDTYAHYKLTADIDLGGAEWTPVGFATGTTSNTDYAQAFCGVFDGDGHTVSNFTITRDDTPYIGFFGFIRNGVVKNLTLDSFSINVESESRDKLYVGGIAGRVVSLEAHSKSELTNCSVTNAQIDAYNMGTVYAGGIIGSAVADDSVGATISLTFVEADGDLNISSKAVDYAKPATQFTAAVEHIVAAGGVIGYYGAQTRSVIRMRNSCFSGNVKVNNLSTPYVFSYAGGVIGELVTYADTKTPDGTCYINSCYSDGYVEAQGIISAFAAGFAAMTWQRLPGIYIDDCYSSADAYVLSQMYDTTTGGFIGFLNFSQFSSSFAKSVTNCYASGDAIDINFKNGVGRVSYAGGFVGYSTGGVFRNCFKLASQSVMGEASDRFIDGLPVLSPEQASDKNSYSGFDFTNTWSISPEYVYPYPTLLEKAGYVNFYSEGAFYGDYAFAPGGAVIAPAENPEKAPTIEHVFVFKHWSLEEEGEAFDFETILTETTNLYAVYEKQVRSYKVSFLADGVSYIPDALIPYGESVVAPSGIPTKEENERFYYEFLYWSDAPDGNKFTFDGYTVSGDVTFYAIFNEIDKTAWKGEISESFSEGNGTAATPYVINSSGDFALFAKLINEGAEGYASNVYYKLGADINLGNNFWIPIGSPEYPFSGSFDGDGYTIKNYKVAPQPYAGLFGYIYNGNVKNVHLSNFDISFNFDCTDASIYAGGLAGYVEVKADSCEISGIRVDASKFYVESNAKNICAGNIIGSGTSGSRGARLVIKNSFATSPVTVINKQGYGYAGGLVGKLDTESSGLSYITHCYYTGAIASTSINSSRAGGLVGYLYSHGSGFSPETSSLAADDTDTMIFSSFAIASVYSKSEKYFSKVGKIVGEVATFASCDTETVRYLNRRDSEGLIVITPAEETIEGAAESLENLTSESFLSERLGFDFESTWIMLEDSDYPVLQCMLLDKPVLEIVRVQREGNGVHATINAFAKAQKYMLMVTVFNEHNQLMKLERIMVENQKERREFNLEYANLPGASRISVSAIDAASLKPLLPVANQEFAFPMAE